MNRNLSQTLMAAALVFTVAGCDSSSAPAVESSQEEATVKGTAKVKGKPIPGGTIHFNASNSARLVQSRDAEVDKAGSFTLKAYVGLNMVSLTPPRSNRAEIKNPAYFGLEYVDKAVQVKAGEENVMDLDLTP